MIVTSHSDRQTVGDVRLVDEMEITGAEIERRKEWLGFGPDDVERLRKMRDLQGGIEAAERLLGYAVQRGGDDGLPEP